jgi:hypothetical protein
MRKKSEVAAVIAVAVLVAIGLYQVWAAFVYGEIRGLPPYWRWVSRGAEPVEFWLALSLSCAGVILLGGLLILVFYGWRSERRWFLPKSNRPTMMMRLFATKPIAEFRKRMSA